MTVLRATAPTFTRPADTTAYAATGDLVANSVTAASVVALNFKFNIEPQQRQLAIREVIIFASGTTITSKALRLHLFSAVPTFATNGDNSAISGNTSGAAGFIGSLDVTAMVAAVDGSWGAGGPLSGQSEVMAQLLPPGADGTSSLFGILEARGAFTPATSETFSVSITGWDPDRR